jgi:hypothetical protein
MKYPALIRVNLRNGICHEGVSLLLTFLLMMAKVLAALPRTYACRPQIVWIYLVACEDDIPVSAPPSRLALYASAS